MRQFGNRERRDSLASLGTVAARSFHSYIRVGGLSQIFGATPARLPQLSTVRVQRRVRNSREPTGPGG